MALFDWCHSNKCAHYASCFVGLVKTFKWNWEMSKINELPEIEFAEAKNYVIKLSETPNGATAIFNLDGLINPSPTHFEINVLFDNQPVVKGEGYTPVKLPYQLSVSRKTLLEHVGKQVIVKYRLIYGGNPAESSSATFRIQH